MKTLLLNDSDDDLLKVAELIKNGDVVGIPTETVYGLGADASNSLAVEKIFLAKGRPSDNPLIVHLSDFSHAKQYTTSIPELAFKLAEKYCPGPLTMILPKNEKIPFITSGGLNTVGIRIPAHKTARKIIELSGKPIAAPSANTSGLPSPTSAEHVLKDMSGKIPAIVDGGCSLYGVESTVISFENEDTVRILRPGFITREDLLEVCPNVIIDKAILNEVNIDEPVSSPGMKYKHYSPKADISLVDSDFTSFNKFALENENDATFFLFFDEDLIHFTAKNGVPYGADSTQQAHNIFSKLRELDEIGAERVYIRVPNKNGIGLAVYNRLIRAAGFEVIKLD